MVGTRALGGQQHEDKIDRLVVDRIVVDRCFELGENAYDFADIGEAPMWNGDALSHTSGAEALALHQRLEDLALR